MVKETPVFSVVALADLMYVAKDLIGLYYKTDEALLMLVIVFTLWGTAEVDWAISRSAMAITVMRHRS